jgi:cleavage stimulation factor subunit 3
VHSVYERFFGVLRADLARLTAAPNVSDSPVEENSGDNNSQETVSATAAPQVNNQQQEELVERKKQYSNAWINYMRFARRAQGHKACRDAFGKARRDDYIGWEVYEAAGTIVPLSAPYFVLTLISQR